MFTPYRPQVSAADVPLRKPAGRADLGLPGMGRKPGTDAGRYQQNADQGDPDPQRKRADDCSEKEGLTMDWHEAEEILKVALEKATREVSEGAYAAALDTAWNRGAKVMFNEALILFIQRDKEKEVSA